MRTTRRHPLHDAIDAARWDAEPPLGRLVVVAHAAFLHAGFVPYSAGGRSSASRRPLPDEIGATASSLSLRYTVPDLLRQTTTQRRRSRAETAVLRLCAHGDHVVFYGYLTGDANQVQRLQTTRHWACIDALSVASVLLSGGLDATAHTLAADGAGLWKKLAGGLARRLFVDMCRKNSKHLPPRLTTLPADLQEDILRRLAVEDIAAVYFTCTGLRDLIAGSEVLNNDFQFGELWMNFAWSQGYLRRLPSPARVVIGRRSRTTSFIAGDGEDRCRWRDPTKQMIERFVEKRSKVLAAGGDGGRRRPVMAARGRRRGDKGAASSRQKWMHRRFVYIGREM
uniref:F-box domain-containing protein n=1 Tax=Oryza meridionalis TaxID=40149 RepID=A0A0E0EVJ5_9ORYZ